MTCNSRIFGILELELSRHLLFSFSITENVTRPGSTMVRPRDRFRFTVWVTNQTALVLSWVRGSISPTPLARFTPTPFDLPLLRPGERVQLATIEATIVRNPGKKFVRLDLIGSVRASASPDLSDIRITRKKPLTYVQPTGTDG